MRTIIDQLNEKYNEWFYNFIRSENGGVDNQCLDFGTGDAFYENIDTNHLFTLQKTMPEMAKNVYDTYKKKLDEFISYCKYEPATERWDSLIGDKTETDEILRILYDSIVNYEDLYPRNAYQLLQYENIWKMRLEKAYKSIKRFYTLTNKTLENNKKLFIYMVFEVEGYGWGMIKEPKEFINERR